MNNKVLVKLIVPEIDEEYDLFIPVNIRIGTIIKILNESLSDINQGKYLLNKKNKLYSGIDAQPYSFNDLVRNTNIRNGSIIVFT